MRYVTVELDRRGYWNCTTPLKCQGPPFATGGPWGDYRKSAGGAAGWRAIGVTASSHFVGGTWCRAVVGWGPFRHPVIFPEPPTQVDHPAAAGTKRVIRIILTVSRHHRVTNRTTHVIHRLDFARTSDISSSTGVTRSTPPRCTVGSVASPPDGAARPQVMPGPDPTNGEGKHRPVTHRGRSLGFVRPARVPGLTRRRSGVGGRCRHLFRLRLRAG